MDDSAANLVTVAVPRTAAEAHFLKNQLEAVGIDVYLADEEAVAMAWHMTGAFGGVKLQVAATDAEDALAFLDRRPWPDMPAATAVGGTAAEDEDDEEEVLSEREQTANRAYRAAVFGLLFFPLEAYALWLFIRVARTRDRLAGKSRVNAKVGALIMVLGILGTCATVSFFIFTPREPALDLRALPHPEVLAGTWEGAGLVDRAECRLWLMLKEDGRLHYRESGSIESECKGAWAFKDGRLLLQCERHLNGLPMRQGKTYAHEVTDFRPAEMFLRFGNDKIRMLRLP